MSRPKVLVVEDDNFTLRAYEEKFKKLNKYDIVMIPDGNLAIAAIKKEQPDVVLLDILLPGVDGFKILQQLKADIQTMYIPVIILSNLGQEEDINRGLALGASDYLVKSDISIKSIEGKIDAVLATISK